MRFEGKWNRRTFCLFYFYVHNCCYFFEKVSNLYIENEKLPSTERALSHDQYQDTFRTRTKRTSAVKDLHLQGTLEANILFHSLHPVDYTKRQQAINSWFKLLYSNRLSFKTSGISFLPYTPAHSGQVMLQSSQVVAAISGVPTEQ